MKNSITSENSYFQLFSNCIPVKGAKRSIVCDLQRNRIRIVSSTLYEIFTSSSYETIFAIKGKFDKAYHLEIDNCFEELEREGWGHFTEVPEAFPNLELTWDSPFQVTNAIIDIGNVIFKELKSVIAELDELGCQALQIRCYGEVPLSELNDILKSTEKSRLKSIELILKYSSIVSESDLLNLAMLNKRIKFIIIHSALVEKAELPNNSLLQIVYTRQVIDSATHCGQVSPNYFDINISGFTEALKYNSCLNRKISIDADGKIKNCPSMSESFGTIQNNSLKSALLKKEFKEVWEINKDQIEVCKDCEFRYICTDCRVFISDPRNRFSKPSKCLYDPYNAVWRAGK